MRADSIKQMKDRAAMAGSQVFDQQWAFDHSRRIDPTIFQHLVEIGRAGIAVTAMVAQITQDSHTGAVIQRQPVVIVAGLIVPEWRDDTRDSCCGALFLERRDLL